MRGGFLQQVVLEGFDLPHLVVLDSHQQRVHVLGVYLEIVHMIDMCDDVVDDVAAPGRRFGVGIQYQHVIALVARRAARRFGKWVCQQATEKHDSRQDAERNAGRFLQKIHVFEMQVAGFPRP
jgi:gamma-glutamyl-gamma-aminobutyrate hydrolase PuuD